MILHLTSSTQHLALGILYFALCTVVTVLLYYSAPVLVVPSVQPCCKLSFVTATACREWTRMVAKGGVWCMVAYGEPCSIGSI